MTDSDVIELVLSSKKPQDIFNGDWKPLYKKYSRLIHPDLCKKPYADKAMAMMNEYKVILENGITFTDETGDFKVFTNEIIYEITDENRDLIQQSFDNFKILKSRKDSASINFHRYLPKSMKKNNTKLIITLEDRGIPLSNQKLEQIHVNWVFSRMFEVSLWFKNIGYSHLGINPTSVFVIPETHGIIITTFYHMTKLNTKASTISAKYKMWYPTTLFTEKIATQDIDLELCKKTAIYLLGDRSAAGTKLKVDKDVNQEVLMFLLIKHRNDNTDYDKYREILKKNFERKYYPLNI